MTTQPPHDLYDFSSMPASVEQQMLTKLEGIDASLKSIETRLFAYINSLTAPKAAPAAQNAMIPTKAKGK